ncbi:EamA family transporter [Polymorphospora sp. NPDC051019]|uniref:EamA family transporter n=1 Tax=Polymorphospora sp. NPDC051019 TaxID=3155725 RepID=UPI00341323E5
MTDGSTNRRPVRPADEVEQVAEVRGRVVAPPREPDRQRRRVAQRPVRHPRPGILVRGGLGGDPDGLPGGDQGEPLVYLLVLPGPASDLPGVGLGLLAGACWAAYILLNRLLGSRRPGLQAPAAATAVSALACLPVAVVLLVQGRLHGGVLFAAVAGLLSSVVPYAADLIVLRRVPARLFGVVMSVHPVLAALAGLVLLHQVLDPHEWAGIAIVVAVNAFAVAARAGGPASDGAGSDGAGSDGAAPDGPTL